MAESARAGHLRRTYGITENQYNQLLDEQGGVCAVCGNPPKKKRLDVDHDHKTGLIRGLLCWSCNHRLIGSATEPKRFEAAAKYLRHPPAHDVLGYIIVPPKKPRKRRKKNG